MSVIESGQWRTHFGKCVCNVQNVVLVNVSENHQLVDFIFDGHHVFL